MKTPFARRADAFAAALDAAAAGSPAAVAGSADPLVRLVERLSAVPQRPLEGMAAGFRAELLASSATASAPLAASTSSLAPAVAPGAATTAVTGVIGQVVAGAVALTVAVTGVGVAAARSHPGDPLHALRRLVAGTSAVTAASHAEQLTADATDRLAELRRLVALPDLDAQARADALVAQLSADLDALLDRVHVGSVTPELVAQVTRIWNELADLVPALPAGTQRAALETLTVVNNRLGAIVDGASPVSRRPGGPGVTPLPPSATATGTPRVPSSPQPSPSSIPLPGPAVPTPLVTDAPAAATPVGTTPELPELPAP